MAGYASDADDRARRRVAFLLSSLGDDGPRMHSISGPGGIGKSRLAAEICAVRISGAVTWVSLAAVRQSEFVLSTIAAVAGLPRDASLTAMAAELDKRTSLLVLDTFEPVLTAAAEVAGMLDLTTRLRVLITSRAPASCARRTGATAPTVIAIRRS